MLFAPCQVSRSIDVGMGIDMAKYLRIAATLPRYRFIWDSTGHSFAEKIAGRFQFVLVTSPRAISCEIS